jgi:hypothetical protein
VKLAVPFFKTKFIDGLYSACEEVVDVEAVKSQIAISVMKQMECLSPNTIVEVVLFRRSDIGFILSEDSPDLEDSK